MHRVSPGLSTAPYSPQLLHVQEVHYCVIHFVLLCIVYLVVYLSVYLSVSHIVYLPVYLVV